MLLQAGRLWVQDLMRQINFSIYLILPAALGSGVYSASNKNEYQKHKNNVSVDRAWLVCRMYNLTTTCESIV
jgi:hypothetical protein